MPSPTVGSAETWVEGLALAWSRSTQVPASVPPALGCVPLSTLGDLTY